MPKLSEAIAEYKASSVYANKSKSTRKNQATYFKAWQERLGDMRVDRITKADIIAVRDDLLADKRVGGSEEAEYICLCTYMRMHIRV